MASRLIFGPNLSVAASDAGEGRPSSRPDAITVAGDLDEVVKALRDAQAGWAEFVMQVTADSTRRIYVNAGAVRYVREL